MSHAEGAAEHVLRSHARLLELSAAVLLEDTRDIQQRASSIGEHIQGLLQEIGGLNEALHKHRAHIGALLANRRQARYAFSDAVGDVNTDASHDVFSIFRSYQTIIGQSRADQLQIGEGADDLHSALVAAVLFADRVGTLAAAAETDAGYTAAAQGVVAEGLEDYYLRIMGSFPPGLEPPSA